MATTNTVNLNSATQNTSNTKNMKKATTNTKNSYESYERKTKANNKKTYTYSDIFTAASKKYNIPKELLEAVAYTESSFNTNATSYCGAMGLMQLMPATAKSLGVNDAYDPVQNVMGGAKYLSQMLKKYNGDTSLALAAYNGGPGNVAKHGGVPSFCEAYVNKVENLMKKGVRVPNKSTTVDVNSNAGQTMAKYIDGSSNTSIKISKNTEKDASVQSNKQSKASTSYDTALANNNVSNNSSNVTNYEELFNYAAKEYKVPSEVLKAIAYTQSSFNASAVSKSGAVGIMQLMPATAKELGVTNSFDPAQNVMGGAKYLSQLLNRYDGNITYAVAAYSAGMGNVDSYNGIPPFARNFVNKVISLSKKGVLVPNITLESSLFSKNNNYNSKNSNTKDESNKKILIDLQV